MKNCFEKMSAVLLVSATVLALTACDSDNEFTDDRDDKTYKTVVIGERVWMAENLNFQTGESVCYENKPENCDRYGRLYSWQEALKACPEGWHLPSRQEFGELEAIAGRSAGDIDRAAVLIRAQTDWADDDGKCEGDNVGFGFLALPAGYYNRKYNKSYDGGKGAYLWSSTEGDSDRAYSLLLYKCDGHTAVFRSKKVFGFSVRCIKN